MFLLFSCRHPLGRTTLGLVALLLTATAWGEAAPRNSSTTTTLPGTAITVASAEQGEVLSADVESLLATPFETVAASLGRSENWCQFMPLHFNIKACTHESHEGGKLLTLYSGRKGYQSAAESYGLQYRFEVTEQSPQRLSLLLDAARGPAGTRDYRIVVTAERVAAGTRLHIHSAYRPSMTSALLTRSYLSTLGRGKVGFSQVEEEGVVRPVQGLRGIIERNVVRYQLAIEAFLVTQPLPAAARHEAALHRWFEENERYPQQLHEMSEAEYLAIKRREWSNQQQLQQALSGQRPPLPM